MGRSINISSTRKSGFLLLLNSAIRQDDHDPGYIQATSPACERTERSTLTPRCGPCSRRRCKGNGDRALESSDDHPITHADSPDAVEGTRWSRTSSLPRTCTAQGSSGRGGWTWYTGSARGCTGSAGINSGIPVRGTKLFLEPCVPASWREFTIEYRYGSATYAITVINPTDREGGIGGLARRALARRWNTVSR